MTDAGVEVPERKAVPRVSPGLSPVSLPELAVDATQTRTETAAENRDALASTPARSLPFDTLVQTTARDLSLDAALLHAIVSVESGYDALAVSPKGAIGLMQVRPQTGARFGFRRLEDPAENLRAGATYLQWLLTRFDGDLSLALAAYNAGEGAVLRYGRQIPPFRETQDYVRKVMAGYARLADGPKKAVAPAAAVASPVGTAAVTQVRSADSRDQSDRQAWRILRGLGALMTRSPSKRGAAAAGRDQPAVVMPTR
ncbi:lytic transglycosylase domain-containing protein [Pandoraea pneumonica]